MNLRSLRIAGMLTASAIVIACAASPGSAATPTTAKTIRHGDFIGVLSDTRSAGHVEFMDDSLRVYTDNDSSQAKAAEYFQIAPEFPTEGSISWTGTSPAPGAQLVFDVDGITGNGNDYNILVGESIYGQNWWLTNGSSPAAKAADPSRTNDGGNGSAYFGTLADWKAAMPQARAVAGGFSLGSGVLGNGYIDSITFGTDSYVFTDRGLDGATGTTGALGATGATGATGAQGPVGPAGSVTTKSATDAIGHYGILKPAANRMKITLSTENQDTAVAKKVSWVVKADGKPIAVISQGHGAKSTVTARFEKLSGTHTVSIVKNKDVIRTLKVRTGR